MTLAENIRNFRAKNLLTIREAAEIFGVSPSELHRLENSQNKPHMLTEARWAKKLEEAERKVGK